VAGGFGVGGASRRAYDGQGGIIHCIKLTAPRRTRRGVQRMPPPRASERAIFAAVSSSFRCSFIKFSLQFQCSATIMPAPPGALRG
jgi:hypothetical protein